MVRRATAFRAVSVGRLLALALVWTAGSACGRDAPDAPDAPGASVRELGPYRVDGVDYQVELTTLGTGDSATVVRMRILDADGRVHVDEEYGDPQAGPRVWRTIVPAVLEGESGSALLLEREESIQIYDGRDGALTALSVPFAPYGEIRELRTDEAGVRHLAEGDILHVDAWRYHYGLTVPIAVDLACEPGTAACFNAAPDSLEPASGYGLYPVTTDLQPIEQGGAVQLHEAPGSEAVEAVAVRAGANVVVHAAAADVQVGGERTLDLQLRAEWLRVSIDDREGWITGPAAFELIGLPPSG